MALYQNHIIAFTRGVAGPYQVEANKRDMPYQSLIKVWLAGDVSERRRTD